MPDHRNGDLLTVRASERAPNQLVFEIGDECSMSIASYSTTKLAGVLRDVVVENAGVPADAECERECGL